MPPKTAASTMFCALTLALAACGQAEPERELAGEPVSASPTPAPGVPQAELVGRQAISLLGVAARDLVSAENLEDAREAVALVERRLGEVERHLPANIATGFNTALQSARDAVARGDLAAAKVAGTAMVNSVLTSEQVQDPSLIRPGETGA